VPQMILIGMNGLNEKSIYETVDKF